MHTRISNLLLAAGMLVFAAGVMRVAVADEAHKAKENQCTEPGRKQGLPCSGNGDKDVPIQGRKRNCPGIEVKPGEWRCPALWIRIKGAGNCGSGGPGECEAASGLNALVFLELEGDCGAQSPDCQPGAPTGGSGVIDECVCKFQS